MPIQPANQALARAQLSAQAQLQLPTESDAAKLTQRLLEFRGSAEPSRGWTHTRTEASDEQPLGSIRLRQRGCSLHDSSVVRLSVESHQPLLSAESHTHKRTHSLNQIPPDSQPELSSRSRTWLKDITLSIDSGQPLLAVESPEPMQSLSHLHPASQPELSSRSRAQLSEIRLSIDSIQSVEHVKSQIHAQPASQAQALAESEAQAREQDRERTSLELRNWAYGQAQEHQRQKTSSELKGGPDAQSKKNSQNPAFSGIRNSLEMQSRGRNRSLDLLRADVKNIRLSIESAHLPKDEKMRCISMEGQSMKVIPSKEAFGIIAEGCQCVITGFAFEHMIKASHQVALQTSGPTVRVCV